MNEETLFHAALGKPAADRAAFLAEACAGEPQLRVAVEALLAEHELSGGPLDQPPVAPSPLPLSPAAGERGWGEGPGPVEPASAATDEFTPNPGASSHHDNLAEAATVAPVETPSGSAATPAGDVIAGRYTLVEKIGEGGMGEVWIAQQSEPVKRRVALKLIKTGMDSQAVLARFEQERQALALMDHPNIAKVLDGGMTATGQPFFVMELVNGQPLTTFCDEAKLTPRERLDLFVPICQAVQHARRPIGEPGNRRRPCRSSKRRKSFSRRSSALTTQRRSRAWNNWPKCIVRPES